MPADGNPIILEEEREVPKELTPSAHRIVWNLAWPGIALNSLQTLNQILDAKFMGMLGPDALSATGAAIAILFLLGNIAMALGAGTTALVSRFYGARAEEDLRTACRQSLSLSLLLGVVMALLGALILPLAGEAFIGRNTPAEREFFNYLYPVLWGIPPLFVLMSIASSLRAIGDTKTPMYVSGFQILLHIALSYLLIFPTREITLSLFPQSSFTFQVPGAGWGIAGGGWGFTLSAWVSALLYFPAGSRTALGSLWKVPLPRADWAWRLTKIATPAAGAGLIRVTSLMAFTAALKHTEEGVNALGALRVGISMESLAFMPAFGYMIAASALVGQSLGRKDPEEAERLAWSAARQAVSIMTAMSILFLIFAPYFASFFTNDPLQRESAVLFLRIMAITEPFFGYQVVLTGAHQGAGDTLRPMVASFISMWLFRATCVWIFAAWLFKSATAAWWVMSLTQLLNGCLLIWLFKKGDWKTREV